MDSTAEIISEEAAKEFPGISNPSKLSNEQVNRIAEAVVEEAAEDVGVRDIMIGSIMGKGAIPLYGRETRQEPCACCLIDPAGPNAPENRMCTTKGAIGTLKDSEEREWCSEIKIVSDGRCSRARSIREAARECKEKHPDDTAKFFECYIPAFSQITRGSNPGAKEPWQMTRAEFVEANPQYPNPDVIHRSAVFGAVNRGEVIAPEVLNDYPDLAERYKEVLKPEVLDLTYVTITDPGKTTFKEGEVISRETFEKENERVKKLSEKPATGRVSPPSDESHITGIWRPSKE